MDAAKMALGGGDVTAQSRGDLGQLLADLNLLLGVLLEVLEDLGVDHDAGCVVRHLGYGGSGPCDGGGRLMRYANYELSEQSFQHA